MTITAQAPPKTGAGEPGETPSKGGGKKKVVLLLVLLLVIGGAAYWFVLKPSPKEEPKEGEVVRLDPIQVNLAGGSYLRVGIALQLTDEAEEADGSKALDATIELFSGRSMTELTRPADRAELKKQLDKELEELYHGEVMDVYFTEFVTQ